MFSQKIIQKNISKTQENQKGFTLLFAVLVSALVLAVGASIVLLAMKQVVLSGVGRDSQFAFYASNTGIECALYWDFAKANGQDVFATSTGSNIADGGALCVGIDIADRIYDQVEHYGIDDDTGIQATTNFRLTFDNPVGPGEGTTISYCVDVSVIKKQVSDLGRTRIETTIISRGYNTCEEENARRIERGLELTY